MVVYVDREPCPVCGEPSCVVAAGAPCCVGCGFKAQDVKNDLKPCPLCGGEARFPRFYYLTKDHTLVQCSTSGCLLSYVDVNYPTKEEAIAAWNSRPSPWISVDDAPKEDGAYFVVLVEEDDEPRWINVAWYSTFAGRGIWDKGHGKRRVTHWAPLHKMPERTPSS